MSEKEDVDKYRLAEFISGVGGGLMLGSGAAIVSPSVGVMVALVVGVFSAGLGWSMKLSLKGDT